MSSFLPLDRPNAAVVGKAGHGSTTDEQTHHDQMDNPLADNPDSVATPIEKHAGEGAR
ncbi:hypothetical protein [Mesorhizobium sp. B1-1-8]|uniref:hypothetical protein n=1 Tax=Mesorhizobium sp. B1-1-8 TaxID=2589976 RepID=UPI0015E323E7|nr:hypothetical protein [Mesorhizobium sp. B1-1-8]UCI06796.1 hypothetical protein FJ974_23790 [Mesorhizobium sp. B1-1-8]